MSLIQTPESAPAAPAAESTPAPAPAAASVEALTAALDPAASTPAAAAPAVESVAPAAPVRPEGVPDAYWDAATGFKTTEALARLGELEAAESIRKEGVPADVKGYKLELPAPVNDPVTGNPIAINPTDPLAVGALDWAHKNGVSQAALSELLGTFVTNELATSAKVAAEIASETAKLGAGASARISAVSTALAQHAGDVGAKAIMASVSSADAVVALEKIIKGLTGPALGTPPAANPADKLAGLSGVDLLSATLK